MSLSVNNNSRVNSDAAHLDKHTVLPTALGEPVHSPSLGTATNYPVSHHGDSAFFNNGAMMPAAALTKLFDMLDLVFKAMREMLSANTLPSNVKPELGRLPAAVTPHEVVKPELGKLPEADARHISVKPDASKPRIIPHPNDMQPDLSDLDVERIDIPQSEMSVVNDAKTNVNVNVSVGGCHCPDKKVAPDAHATMNALALPSIDPRSKAERAVLSNTIPERHVPHALKSDVTPGLSYKLEPLPNPEITPDTTPPLPDANVPDLTSPGPAENLPDKKHWRLGVGSASRF